MFMQTTKHSIGWSRLVPACLVWLILLLTATIGHARPMPLRPRVNNRAPVAVATATPLATSPANVTAVDPTKCYQLVSRASDKVLTLLDRNDGAPLATYIETMHTGQRWKFISDGAYYNLQSQTAQKGVQVVNASTAENALLEGWSYWGGSHQQWTVQRNAEGYFTLINRNANKAMTVLPATAGAEARVGQQTLNAAQQQQWSLDERGCSETDLPNRPPVIVAASTSLTGASPLSVTFNTTGTYDPNDDRLAYLWVNTYTGAVLSREANPVLYLEPAFPKQGGDLITEYNIKLTVTDSKGDQTTAEFPVRLSKFPPVRIISPATNSFYSLKQASTVFLAASITATSSFTSVWQATLRYNGRAFPQPPITETINNPPQITLDPVGCNGESYSYRITVNVTDAQGASATDSSIVYPDPNCGTANVNISGLTATTLANGSVRLNWAKGSIVRTNAHDVLVVGRLGGSFTSRPASASYVTNTSFTSNGGAYDGGKALYQGLDSSLVVTNLTPGQRYFFRVYTRVPNAITNNAWSGGIETSVTIPVATTTAPPTSVTAVEAGKCYRLVARASGKVLSLVSLNDGAQLAQYTEGAQAGQRWRFTPDGAYYNITSQTTQKGVQVVNASLAENALLENWTYWGGSYQQWTLRRNAEGYYTIVNRNSNKAMTVLTAIPGDEARIGQQTLGTAQQQQWSIEERSCTGIDTPTPNRAPVAVATTTSLSGTSPLSVTFTGNKSYDPDGDPITYEWDFGDGTTYVTDANPVKVFVAKPAQSGTGLLLNYTVRLTVIDNKGLRSPVQTVYVVLQNPTSATTIDSAKCYRVQSRSSGLALTVPAGAGTDGTSLQQRTNAEQPWQKWRFTPDGSYYRIAAVHSQKAIQVANSSTADNALLEQWTYWGGGHQQWTATRNAEGFFTLSNRNSGKAMTVQGASTADGAGITQQTLGTGTNQQWTLAETTCPTGARLAAAEPGSGTSFLLYPNPAADHVLIDLSRAQGQPVHLKVHNLLGVSLQETYLEAAPAVPYRFRTDQLPNGLYLMQVRPTGQAPTTLRLLIQH